MEQRRGASRFGEMRRLLAYVPRRLAVLSFAVMAGIVLAAAGLIDLAWEQVNRVEEQSVWNLALSASDDFNLPMRNALVKLDQFMDDVTLDNTSRSRAHLEADVRANSELFGALLVVDSQNHVQVATSGQFNAGSVASSIGPAVALDELAFGPPLAVGGETWLPLVRPIGEVGGRYLTVVALLRLSYFQAHLNKLRRDPGVVISVIEQDGQRLIRVPALLPGVPSAVTPAIIQAITADETLMFDARSRVDHIEKLMVVMQDSAFPVGVVAAVPLSEFFQIWWPRAATIVAIAALLLLVKMFLYLALATELYRRHQAEARSMEAVKEAHRVGAQYRLLADHCSDVIIHIGFDRVCRYVSPAVEHMLGWTKTELVGRDTAFLLHPEDAELLHEEVQFLTKNSGPLCSRCRQLHRDGHYVWVEANMQAIEVGGKADGFVASLRDISDRIEAEEKLAAAAAEMAKLAATDQLTGIANRRRFSEELARQWRQSAREELPLSLLLIDVDFFKPYNDSYGHQAGDEVLKAVAATIVAALHRPADLAARWGGEEFAVLLPATDIGGAIGVAEIVRSAIEALHTPHRGAVLGYLTASVGVATAYPCRNQSSEPLVAEADANLYEAKRRGRNRVGAPPTDPVLWAGM